MCVSECESNSVKVTQINSTQSDNHSGGAMGEENVETAKSELRLGMKCILHREFVYTQMRKGKCNLVWSGSCNECQTSLQCLLPHAHDLIRVHIAVRYTYKLCSAVM